MFELGIVAELERDLERMPALVHVLTGPRQVGKTTAALLVKARWRGPTRYAAADEFLPPSVDWIRAQWDLARLDARRGPALLVLDEIQKVPGWSEVVKAEWDTDRRSGLDIRVLLLGSSALLLSRGTYDSLAGRFFLHRCLHWTYLQCREAFGWDLDQFLFFGGYPGAAMMADDVDNWRRYIRDSLIEAVLARDVLALTTVQKPALLRQLFALAARFPSQVLSYNKMLGQLQDAGNTTTLSHYLKLLEHSYLVSGLERYSAGQARSRGSSPKLLLWNNALINALDTRSAEEARSDAVWWGRLVENAVGAHLMNGLIGTSFELLHWRKGSAEVDFVVRNGAATWAIEVKSGRSRPAAGLSAFKRVAPRARALMVGAGGLSLEEFFSCAPKDLFSGRSHQ